MEIRNQPIIAIPESAHLRWAHFNRCWTQPKTQTQNSRREQPETQAQALHGKGNVRNCPPISEALESNIDNTLQNASQYVGDNLNAASSECQNDSLPILNTLLRARDSYDSPVAVEHSAALSNPAA
ncbi:hypothetical protein ACHAQJ_000165 [Trichoderma viride]